MTTTPDEERARVLTHEDGTPILRLRFTDLSISHFRTLELGIERQDAEDLFHALGAWMAGANGHDFQIAGDWGVEGGGDTAEKTLAKLARLRSRYPTSHVRASERVAITFEDDSAYYGPWQELGSETTEEQL